MDIKVLVRREINCSSITKEEFIIAMTEDLMNAVKVYNEYWWPIEEENHKKNVELQKKSITNIAKKYAEKKWKTEAKRQEYINKKLSEYVPGKVWHTNLTFLDFDTEPLSNGISDCCILEPNNLSKLPKCFEKIKDNKYFKRAQGWILEDHHNSRPQIKLILPEDVQKEYEADETTLWNAISEFYRGCTYFGD